ncbi:MAG: Gfo/Idh/MocA family oxidoreductase [Lachnospiraceae bacterium]|nr:Gfo/Idh/MocA family oxidoreductase [Lachnospiraceae bacterium]
MKLGIVGNGVIVEEVLSFIHEIWTDEIYICGRAQSRDKLETLAKRYELARVFVDYQEFLQSDVEVVYIGLLNDLHVEYATMAIRKGKHVICEKPMAPTLLETKQLAREAADAGVLLFEAMSVYHMPAFMQLQKDLQLIGEVKMCNFNYSQMSRRYAAFHEGKQTPAVFDPAHAAGCLRDLNVYNIAAAVGLFGKPKNVQYFPNMERGIDTSGVLVASYDGFQCVLMAAKECTAPGPSTIQGVEGTITIYPHVNGMTGYEIHFNDGRPDVTVSFDDAVSRLYYEFLEYQRIIDSSDEVAYEKLQEYTAAAAWVVDEAALH